MFLSRSLRSSPSSYWNSLALAKNVWTKGNGAQFRKSVIDPFKCNCQSQRTIIVSEGLGGGSGGIKCRGVLLGEGSRRWLKTSAKRDAIPPVLLVVLSRVAKFGAMFFGRSMRLWWKKLTPEQKQQFAGKIRRNRYILSGKSYSLQQYFEKN